MATPERDVEYLPQEFWGFDPSFQTFNKMYVQDVLSMPEYPTSTGAYAYNNHPIYKVEVVGMVVQVDQNQKCYMYGVDDGTGVITCCCWKESYFAMKLTPSDREDMKQCLPRVLYKRVEEFLTGLTYELGDHIKIRGKIKVFREQREIIASYHSKVTQPMEVLSHMALLPNLYRQFYDKAYNLPESIQYEIRFKDGTTLQGSTDREIMFTFKKAISCYIDSGDIKEFTLDEVKSSEACQHVLNSVDPLVDVMKLITDALKSLEELGIICTRSGETVVYEVIGDGCLLTRKCLDILSKECGKSKYQEKGCHYLHVWDKARKTVQYSMVNKQCVKKSLDILVLQSDAIMTTLQHYMTLRVSWWMYI